MNPDEICKPADQDVVASGLSNIHNDHYTGFMDLDEICKPVDQDEVASERSGITNEHHSGFFLLFHPAGQLLGGSLVRESLLAGSCLGIDRRDERAERNNF